MHALFEPAPLSISPAPSVADGLPRAAPSAQGVDADAVAAWLEDVAAAGLDLHAFMLHRHGHVVAESWRWPYRADRRRNLHSVAKSFTACAVGLALEEGRFRRDDRVVAFFPEAPSDPGHPCATMTVSDLLTMRTGHAGETSGAAWRQIDSSWVAEFFRIPVDHPPGSRFVYTSAASYMLSAIVSRTTGETLHDYLKPRLLVPLGITGETWDIGPDGINPGGNGLVARTVDLLKLGVLHAQRGVWEGRRLLPESWVAESTRAQEASGRYGYHWWVHGDGGFSAIGKFVQMVKVFPEHGATLAVTGAMKGSKLLMPHIDRYFPRALLAEPFAGEDRDSRLAAALGHWQSAETDTPWQRAFDRTSGTGFYGADFDAHATTRRYTLDPNDAGASELRLTIREHDCVLTLVDPQGEHTVTAGFGGWIEGATDMPGAELHHGYAFHGSPVVARAGWVDRQCLRMVWIYPETAFRDTVECRLQEDRIHFTRTVNVNSGPLEQNLSGTRRVRD
ncbi:MAG TPA: serine hydrolase [Paraburkholderia sp.]|jgi:CubicO group peptidase (beta-lactamase class C family)